MIGKSKFKFSVLTAVGGLSLLGSVIGAGASDGNLLENGEFLDGIAHWSAEGEMAQYGATEIQSMYLMNMAPADAGLPAIVYQCIDVSGGAQYDFEAGMTMDAEQARSGAAWLATYWWEGEDCAGSLLDTTLSEPARQTSTMQYQPTAPDGARSAWAAVMTTQDPAAPKDGDRPFVTLWDDVYFGLAAEQTSETNGAGTGEPTDLQVEGDDQYREPLESNENPGDAGELNLMLVAGVAVAVVGGGAVLLPARRKR
jgi:hypothetical protein